MAAEDWSEVEVVVEEADRVEELEVEVVSLLSDWDSEDGADDWDARDVVEALRVLCFVLDTSSVVEELLREDTARAVEVMEMVGLAIVEDEEDKRLPPVIALVGAGGSSGLDPVGSSLSSSSSLSPSLSSSDKAEGGDGGGGGGRGAKARLLEVGIAKTLVATEAVTNIFQV